jgi:solute carrier family 25 protein 34/35
MASASSAPRLSALESMASSGAGAAAAVVFTNPLEVAKSRLQMDRELRRGGTAAYSGVTDCLRATWAREGVSGVQRGLALSCVRDGTKCFFRLGLFDPIVAWAQPGGGQAALHVQLLAGGVSGCVASLLCNPLDLVKVRIQSSGGLVRSHHAISDLSTAAVFRKVVADEGVRGLWRGTPVNIVRGISFTSVLMTLNSRVKHGLASVGLRDGFARDAAGAFVGSAVGILFMNPLDVLRTRLYNQPPLPAPQLYAGVADAALKIARAEGPLAFWKGAAAHYLRVGPHTVLSFVFIGKIQRWVLDRRRV